MHLRTAELLGGQLLPGHAADHVRAGDEHPSGRREDDHVGQCRPVGGTPRGGPDDQADLRHDAARPGHRREHRPDGVQRPCPLQQTGATGVPDADDRQLGLDRSFIGVDDAGTPLFAERASLDPWVGGEDDGPGAVEATQPPGGTVAADGLGQRAPVAESGQPPDGVGSAQVRADVELRIGPVVQQRAHTTSSALRKARAVLCPPKPKDVDSAMPLVSFRGSNRTMSRPTSSSGSSSSGGRGQPAVEGHHGHDRLQRPGGAQQVTGGCLGRTDRHVVGSWTECGVQGLRLGQVAQRGARRVRVHVDDVVRFGGSIGES